MYYLFVLIFYNIYKAHVWSSILYKRLSERDNEFHSSEFEKYAKFALTLSCR